MRRRDMLLGCAALGVAGCGSDSSVVNPAGAQVPPPTTQSLLYVLNAGGGSQTGDVLRLTEVSGRVVFFSDRPARNSGQQSVQEFVAGWTSNGFSTDPPNADLQVGVGSQATGYLLELRDPVYDATTDTLTFRVTSLDGRPAPAQFGAAVLFVDSGFLLGNGGAGGNGGLFGNGGAGGNGNVGGARQPFEVIFEVTGPANQTARVTLAGEGGDAVFSISDDLEVVGNGFVLMTQRSFQATSVANANYTVEVAITPAAGATAVLLSATGGTVTYSTSTASGTLSATPTRIPLG